MRYQNLFRLSVIVGLIVTLSSCQSNSSSLLTAIRKQDAKEVRRLIAAKTDLNPPSGPNEVNKPLAYAAAYGNLEIVKLLVEAGAELDGRAAYGDVALIKADEHGNDDILEYLIEQGADVNIPNAYGVTPFIGLCGTGRLQQVQLAAKHGGDANSSFVAKNGEGAGEKNFTPLEAAASAGKHDVVELLLSMGADPNIKDAQGRSLLELAESDGHDDVAAVLRKHLKSSKKDSEANKSP